MEEAARAEYKRQHYLENKEKYKKRYLTFKEKHKEMLTIQYTCECGGVYRWATKAIHKMTKRHTLYAQKVEEEDLQLQKELKVDLKVENKKNKQLKEKLEEIRKENDQMQDSIELKQINTLFKIQEPEDDNEIEDACRLIEEKSNAEWAIQHNCPCGGVYTKSTRNIHNRSKRHILMVDPSMKVVFPKVMLWN
jgi:hypothetical protein